MSVIIHSGHYKPSDADSKAWAYPIERPTSPERVTLPYLPPPPVMPLEAPKKEHELNVTLRILPPLVRYTGCNRFGIRSRGWGNGHEGESIRVEKVEIIQNHFNHGVEFAGRAGGLKEYRYLVNNTNANVKIKASLPYNTQNFYVNDEISIRKEMSRIRKERECEKLGIKYFDTDMITITIKETGCLYVYQDELLKEWPLGLQKKRAALLREENQNEKKVSPANDGDHAIGAGVVVNTDATNSNDTTGTNIGISKENNQQMNGMEKQNENNNIKQLEIVKEMKQEGLNNGNDVNLMGPSCEESLTDTELLMMKDWPFWQIHIRYFDLVMNDDKGKKR